MFKHCQTSLYQIHTDVMLGQLCITSCVEMIQTCHQTTQEKICWFMVFSIRLPLLRNLFLLGYKEFGGPFKYFLTIKLQRCWITKIQCGRWFRIYHGKHELVRFCTYILRWMKVPLISFYIEIALSKYIMFSTFQHYSFHCLDSLSWKLSYFNATLGFDPSYTFPPNFRIRFSLQILLHQYITTHKGFRSKKKRTRR